MSGDVWDGDWRLMSESPGVRHWYLQLEDGSFVIKTEHLVDNLLAQNAEMANNSLGQRWGDGKVAASIPLNVFFKELGEAHKNGDDRYVKKWLNDSDHSKFRTFKGRL